MRDYDAHMAEADAAEAEENWWDENYPDWREREIERTD